MSSCMLLMLPTAYAASDSAAAGSADKANAVARTAVTLPDAPVPQTSQSSSSGAAQSGISTAPQSDEGKQTKRILGIVPNFRAVSANQKLPPDTARDKFKTAILDSFDYSAILPVALHQDNRYYTLGHGGFVKRTAYSFTRTMITRNDGGSEVPNYSELLGAGTSSSIAALYYPSQYRTWTKIGQRWLTAVIIDGVTFSVKEFWPDVNNAIFHQKD